jgi:hypothetical protein
MFHRLLRVPGFTDVLGFVVTMSLVICLERWLTSSPQLIAFLRTHVRGFISPYFLLYCFAFSCWWAAEKRYVAFWVFFLAETLLAAVGIFLCPPRDWLHDAPLPLLTAAVRVVMWVVPWVILLRLPRRRRFYLISERV